MKNNKPFGTPFGALLLMLLFAMNAMAQTPSKQAEKPKHSMQFEKVTHDFGSIPQGTPVTVKFTFKNTGKTPLLISNVQASCGCTTPDYTKEPIAPGKKGSITATYNAAAVGQFNKTITVTSNGGDPIMLTLQGTVQAQNNSATPQQQPLKNQ
jgi:hypothetical protein